MAEILIEDLHLSFPVLHTGHRSLKKTIVSTATGGAIQRDARALPIVHALQGISMHIHPGDRIALIGPNGSGKSTLLRVMAGIYEPTAGYIRTDGEIVPLLDLNLGLNGDMTGRENILTRGMYLGIPPKDFERFAPEIEEFTELGPYLDLPVRTYSSGMQMRLSLGVATTLEPDILLMDEWVLAGDAKFLSKARERMSRFVEKASILVVASHSEEIIKTWCNKAVYLKAGVIQAIGSVDDVMREYKKAA
ncbi:ABC-2 type transport system ATP-binding protein/lipopolysaccharide transport system ATP-binding protein [Chelatococcus caeni]|uniref:ABC-2 type transport system ATP-binding protein/lipopolysaccharide transport system ATP-binding protein n=1 Tax=Chelatococcus caeni TaxID=1348468 RepID=A0A840C177_9HYPH|nr:ABC transporter ATP-binding protein [Chelatococcus caeni]MBB4017398.1 ABC-2 type transport system ATP-binding protein/lipopolysaccharide transport system ATP-binding protein [Chelatococcus caeni]